MRKMFVEDVEKEEETVEHLLFCWKNKKRMQNPRHNTHDTCKLASLGKKNSKVGQKIKKRRGGRWWRRRKDTCEN